MPHAVADAPAQVEFVVPIRMPSSLLETATQFKSMELPSSVYQHQHVCSNGMDQTPKPDQTSSDPDPQLPEPNEKSIETTVSPSWRQEPLSEPESAKVMRVLEACKERDLEALVALCTSSGGLVEDEVRRIACRSQDATLR